MSDMTTVMNILRRIRNALGAGVFVNIGVGVPTDSHYTVRVDFPDGFHCKRAYTPEEISRARYGVNLIEQFIEEARSLHEQGKDGSDYVL